MNKRSFTAADQDLVSLEKSLWASADKLRSNMDAAEYKHVVLGLIFLKYISDAFEALFQKVQAEDLDDPEDRDVYVSQNVFFVPREARWDNLQRHAKSPSVGKVVDDAMDAIERENTKLKGVLPKNYTREQLDKARLGELIDLFSNVGFGTEAAQRQDLLGRVYEYFLGQFADAEGKKGGQFYTPASIVRVLVDMLEPYQGRVYDPCCGSGGMFVQSARFVREHQGRIGNLSIYGQESNQTTYRLAVMNLAIRQIDANIKWGDTFLNDLHPDLKADYIIANPPFNVSDWSGQLLKSDPRWKFNTPPVGNANYAWLQHIIHHLSPTGTAGVVLANGSMTSQSGGEDTIRQNMIEARFVDCMVALPNQLFYNTQIPACLWFLARDRRNHNHRNRTEEILFIDARQLGHMTSRKHKAFSDADVARIADTYHAWRNKGGDYQDVPGFCKSASMEQVRANNYVLTPGRYVGTAETDSHAASFHDTMTRLSAELRQQMDESRRLDAVILDNLKTLGY